MATGLGFTPAVPASIQAETRALAGTGSVYVTAFTSGSAGIRDANSSAGGRDASSSAGIRDANSNAGAPNRDSPNSGAASAANGGGDGGAAASAPARLLP